MRSCWKIFQAFRHGVAMSVTERVIRVILKHAAMGSTMDSPGALRNPLSMVVSINLSLMVESRFKEDSVRENEGSATS